MEPEVQNIVYFGRPVTGISQDMSSVYRMMAQNPQNIQPVKRAKAYACHDRSDPDQVLEMIAD